MALPRNVRSIRIDGANFRWSVTTKAQRQTGKVRLFIKSDHVGDKGIVVYIPCRDFWLDVSDFGKNGFEYEGENYRPVKPSDVRAIILAAMKSDWQPGDTRKQLVFDYDRQQLTLRSALN